MATRVTKRSGTQITLETTVDVGGGFLQAEETIVQAVNEVGATATIAALERFDTDGEPLSIGGEKWYAMPKKAKYYQTPYGEVRMARYVYQKSKGGKTYCPLEDGARMMRNATPRLVKMIAHKLAQNAALDVQRDLEENHGRPVSKLLVQELGAYAGAVVQAREESWTYATPCLEDEITAVGIGLDGCCVLMCAGQWREAMTGSIALYNREGERQHTIYIGAAPEHGKATFFERMQREIAHVRQWYPQAKMIGIADGANSNWSFLEERVDEEILDFYHAAEYVTQAADALFAGKPEREREAWLESRCSLLKHDWDGASKLLTEWQQADRKRWKEGRRQLLEESIRYFSNHLHQMYYRRYQDSGWPIGSGVTEAACKTLVKQRLCRAGMRWKEDGAQAVLSLRALLLTPARWGQFWKKLERYGVPVMAN